MYTVLYTTENERQWSHFVFFQAYAIEAKAKAEAEQMAKKADAWKDYHDAAKVKQTNKQTKNQSINQKIKQSNKQTNKLKIKQTNKQTNKHIRK